MIWYLLVCRECDQNERLLPQPFSSAADRGHWAAEHTRLTGHDRWLVLDQDTEKLKPLSVPVEHDGGVDGAP